MRPSVLQSTAATTALKRGFDQLADLLAITLGPRQGVVLSQHATNPAPELLTDAATIARRVLQLPDRAEDVGAMLLRNLVWRMYLKAGDGSATAAVLAQAIVHHAYRYVAAGGNVMLLRRGLARATAVAVDALRAQAQPVQTEGELAQVAFALTGERDLSALLGALFFKLGADAHVTLEEYLARHLAVEYHDGGRWQARLTSPYFITDAIARRAVVNDCYVVLCDGEVSRADDVQPMLEMVAQTELRRVALIANEIRGDALNVLVVNQQRSNLPIVAVELRRPVMKRAHDFTDLAVITGATVLSAQTGRTLQQIAPSDFGSAKRIEATADEMVVVGFEQHQSASAQQVGALQARALAPDDEEFPETTFRIARLAGKVATLKLGATTDAERALLKAKAERALRALPLALRDGTVAGGGVAYLNCIAALETARRAVATDDERMGVAVLARALEAPFRRIAQNAGARPSALMAEARRCGAGFGYDAVQAHIVDMRAAGIVDAMDVLRLALETAVSGAAMALTTDTIVLHANPQQVYEP